MCQVLAQKAGLEQPDTSFTVGLFSILDALLDQPLDAIMEQLPLSGDVSTALLEYGGDPGRLLELVIAYEQADWAAVEDAPLGLDPVAVRDAYLAAGTWADELLREVLR